MPMERVLLYGVALVLIAAPLPFGSVQPGAAAAVVVVCLGLGVLWIIWRSHRGISPLPWRNPVLRGGALLVLVGVAQLLPLPRSVLTLVSPKAVEFRDRYEPPEGQDSETIKPSALVRPRSPGPRDWRPISLYPWATRQATLRFITCLLVALLTIDLAASGYGRRIIAGALVASGGFQAIYGLFEYFSGRQHIFGYAKRYYTDVATGTFINRNHYAGYLEMTIPVVIALAAASFPSLKIGRGKRVTHTLVGASGLGLFSSVALLLLALTMVTALACSRSRMGILSELLALLVVGLVLLVRGRGKSFAVCVVVVTGAALVLFSQGGTATPIVERFLGAAQEFRADIGRWSMWTQAARMLTSFPLLGVGFGVFPFVFPAFRTTGEGVAVSHAHNDFLELAVEAGAVGIALALAGAALVARSLARDKERQPGFAHLGHAASAGLAAIGFHSLTDFNMAIPSNALTLSVLAGMVICWMRVSAPVLAVDQARQRRWLTRAWAPAGLMAVIAAAAVAPVLAGGSLHSKIAWEEPAAGPSGPDESRAQRLALLLDGDNAERRFRLVDRQGGAALEDLRALVQARARGTGVSSEALTYIERRLAQAIGTQARTLRYLPTSSRGHLELGRLRIGRCTVGALASGSAGGTAPGWQPGIVEVCVSEALKDVRSATELSPMSAATYARAARLLMAAWPLLEGPARSEAKSIIERGIDINRSDRTLRDEWSGIEAGLRAGL